jgi:hypothetical protein
VPKSRTQINLNSLMFCWPKGKVIHHLIWYPPPNKIWLNLSKLSVSPDSDRLAPVSEDNSNFRDKRAPKLFSKDLSFPVTLLGPKSWQTTNAEQMCTFSFSLSRSRFFADRFDLLVLSLMTRNVSFLLLVALAFLMYMFALFTTWRSSWKWTAF